MRKHNISQTEVVTVLTLVNAVNIVPATITALSVTVTAVRAQLLPLQLLRHTSLLISLSLSTAMLL